MCFLYNDDHVEDFLCGRVGGSFWFFVVVLLLFFDGLTFCFA